MLLEIWNPGKHFAHFIRLDAIFFIPSNCRMCFWKTSLSGVVSSNSSSSRNLWVSGLSSNTKAADLKNLFGNYGKVNNISSSETHCNLVFKVVENIEKWNLLPTQVLSAKVVTNARSPGSKCYGLVTMSSSNEVTRCVSHLDCTELHGQQIYVERVS